MKIDQATRRATQMAKGTFAGWKLDVLTAMAGDKDLMPSDFRVGFILIQHLNSQTWLIFPSHERLATMTNMSQRNVIKCLDRLRASGWLKWNRGGRQRANKYQFDSQKVADALAAMKADDDPGNMNPSSYQDGAMIGTVVHTAIRTPVHPNTLNRTRQPKKEAAG